MAESWINLLPDALMQEIYNIDRRVRQTKAVKCDVHSDEDFVKTTISDPYKDLLEEHQDMKALCMTLSGGENLSETTMMDMTIDYGDSSKMDFTILSPDETQLHTKEYVNEALKDHSKISSDAISMQQKKLAALQKELDEYDEILELEIIAINDENEEEEDEDTITNEEESPDNEECCLYRDKIEEFSNQVQTIMNNIMEQEESDIHLEEEFKKLKLSFDDNKQQQCTLKNLIERLEEETVLMENQVRMQAHSKKNRREHLAQGNGLFAVYEDRRQIIIQKNEKIKSAKKEIILSKNKWDVKLKNLKKENLKIIDNLKDDKSWMSQINMSGSKHNKLLTLFKTFEELIQCKPLEYMEFSFNEEFESEHQNFVAKVMSRSWQELLEVRNQILQYFGKNISMIDYIFNSKNKLSQINHLINMEKLETKGLTGEIEELKTIQQANETKEEEVKTRVVTFNVQDDEEGKDKDRIVEKKKPTFKWVKAKKVDLAAILNT